MLVLQFLHLRANLLFTGRAEVEKLKHCYLSIHYLFNQINPIIHTDYHASTDVTELWFLAVVVLKFVRFVINSDDRLLRFWFLLFHLNLLLIYKIHLHIFKKKIISWLFTKTTHGYFYMHAYWTGN